MQTPLTFLIVDDEADGRFLMKRSLENEFPACDVIGCSSLVEALDAAKQARIDAVLTDNKIGGESGVEFIRRLRESGAVCPVVMVTASSDPKVERAAYGAGATKVFGAASGNFAGYLRTVLASRGV